MKKDIQVFEFEWYLRDFFFRTSDGDNGIPNPEYDITDIAELMQKNYLRYKTWNMTQIKDSIETVIAILKDKCVINYDALSGKVILSSNLDRKQCAKCFYINYLSPNEHRACLRCDSENLLEFPFKKKKLHEA